MIVRILGEGQYAVDDAHADLLNGLDSGLERAVEAGDEAGVPVGAAPTCWPRCAPWASRCRTTRSSRPTPSLPDEASSLEEVRAMLADTAEGLIPG